MGTEQRILTEKGTELYKASSTQETASSTQETVGSTQETQKMPEASNTGSQPFLWLGQWKQTSIPMP